MTRWVAADGRALEVVEDKPGVVKVTTEVLDHLLTLAGMVRQQDGEPVDTQQVQRDDHGRCVVCGSDPHQYHREDCQHFRGYAPAPRYAPAAEFRPGVTDGEERR